MFPSTRHLNAKLSGMLEQLNVELDWDDAGLGLQELECPRDGASPVLAPAHDVAHSDLRPPEELLKIKNFIWYAMDIGYGGREQIYWTHHQDWRSPCQRLSGREYLGSDPWWETACSRSSEGWFLTYETCQISCDTWHMLSWHVTHVLVTRDDKSLTWHNRCLLLLRSHGGFAISLNVSYTELKLN